MIVPPKTAKTEWTSVNIDKRMVAAIRKLLPKLYGYKGVADYVQAAVRRKLELDKAVLDMEERKEN